MHSPRWEDHTLASLWKRSQSFSSTSQETPFSKLSLSKLLLLKDRSTREDYFAQQAAFIILEGRKDTHAEFATTIEVDGFRPKLLAVRPVGLGAHKVPAALFRQQIYVLCTLFGLSLPFRIWFAKHCDEIKVTIVKEVCNSSQNLDTEDEMELESKSSWFRGWGGRGPSSATIDSNKQQEQFRKSMQQFSLYDNESSSTLDHITNDTTKQSSPDLMKEDILAAESISVAESDEATTTYSQGSPLAGDSPSIESEAEATKKDDVPSNDAASPVISMLPARPTPPAPPPP